MTIAVTAMTAEGDMVVTILPRLTFRDKGHFEDGEEEDLQDLGIVGETTFIQVETIEVTICNKRYKMQDYNRVNSIIYFGILAS